MPVVIQTEIPTPGKENMPKVSILVTVYNREKYLAGCLDSLLDLTFDDWEVVVVDDCSTDNSVRVAEKYAEADSRIRLYVNDVNLGQFKNRNRAAELATGEYLKYLDSDDLIYPHGLGVMVWALEKFPSAGFAVSYHPKTQCDQPYPILTEPEQAYEEQFFGLGFLDAGPSAVIYRATVFRASGGYKVDGFVGNDSEFHYRLAATYPVVKMPASLFWWRQHSQQAFQGGVVSNEYLTKSHQMMMDTLLSERCPLSPERRRAAVAKLRQHHARRILSIAIRQRSLSLAAEMFANSDLSVAELLSGFRRYAS